MLVIRSKIKETAESKGISNAYQLGLLIGVTANVSDRDEKLWVITEADRSSTTILLPTEY